MSREPARRARPSRSPLLCRQCSSWWPASRATSRTREHFATLYLWNVVVYWSILAGVHARDYRRDLREHRLRARSSRPAAGLHATATGGVQRETPARRHPERLLVMDTAAVFFSDD